MNFIDGGGSSRIHLIQLPGAHVAVVSILDSPRFLIIGLCQAFSNKTVTCAALEIKWLMSKYLQRRDRKTV